MRILLIAFFGMTCIFGSAQINLEATYVQYADSIDGPWLISIAPEEHKYLVHNFHDGTFSLYNLDHSPFMINVEPSIPIYQPPKYYRIAYISRTLFDCDSTNIEWALATTHPGDQFRIEREDGTILLTVPQSTFPYCYGCAVGTHVNTGIKNTEDGAKMTLFRYDGTPGVNEFYIYSLCGELPVGILENTTLESALVYPNPSDGIITFLLPNDIKSGSFRLEIFASDGSITYSEEFSGNSVKVSSIDVSNSTGNYYYRISGSQRVFTGKVLISE